MSLIYILKNKSNNKCYIGQTIKEFEERLHGDHASISRCCKGISKTAGKLHWQYYKDYLKLAN